MDLQHAENQLREYIEMIPYHTGIAHSTLSEEIETSNSTYMSWVKAGNFPLIKLLRHRFGLMILEYAILLKIKLDRRQCTVRLIDIERAWLDVKECCEIQDESLLQKSIAKVKSMLNLLTTAQPNRQQIRLAI